ncbi:hypothetical protein [Alkalibacillus silvisoli]|uniref:Uncharacterized protein n=1 Tax=Alkalibacillus silvisoli TaxID=392823 RepID=A0ABN1A240_9BACI
MFSLRAFIQAIGVSLIITIVISFLMGFFSLFAFEWMIIISFLVSYISIGILASLWNMKTPYFAAFLGCITLTVINFIFSNFVLSIPILLNPALIQENFIYSTFVSMLTAIIVIPIIKRREQVAI